MEIDPDLVFIDNDDLRYKQIEQDVEIHSNAVVIAMMDTSGSMTPQKKYLARSMLFWMVEFLKKSYSNVKIRFIAHTTEAKLVDEQDFFMKGESGGTYCHTAIDKAIDLIDAEYPIEEWNVYCVYVSDGEDFETGKTIQSTQELIKKDINMYAYCEIDVDGMGAAYGSLLKEYKKKFKFQMSTEAGANFYKDTANRFLACNIKDKKHIYPALKHILFEKKVTP
jgi:uncharacterized sporulation protein YeaH/YhbH (DUF444 family)